MKAKLEECSAATRCSIWDCSSVIDRYTCSKMDVVFIKRLFPATCCKVIVRKR